MGKTIEERANEKFPTANLYDRGALDVIDINEEDRNFYIEVATEQKAIDDMEKSDLIARAWDFWNRELVKMGVSNADCARYHEKYYKAMEEK